LLTQGMAGDVVLEARLLVRLAQTFGLDAADCAAVEGAPEFRPLALQYTQGLLGSAGSVGSAVALTLHFQLVELATVDTLRVLVG
jgi:hypothetical protein